MNAIKNPKQTFVAIAGRALLRLGLVGAALIMCHTAATMNAPASDVARNPHLDGPSYTERVVAANDCWTGDAPEGVMPTRVVVRVDGYAQVRGERVVAQAFEQVFDNVDHELEIYAFCP